MKILNAQVFLKRSKGLGDGVVGYGLHLTPSELGPKIVSVTSGGEAARTGLITVGVRDAQIGFVALDFAGPCDQHGSNCLCVCFLQDVIVAVDDEPTKGVDFHQVVYSL